MNTTKLKVGRADVQLVAAIAFDWGPTWFFPLDNHPDASGAVRLLVTEELLSELLALPRHHKQRELHYCRFQLFLILGFFTHLGISTIGSLTRDQLVSMLESKRLHFLDQETGLPVVVEVPEKALAELRLRPQLIETVFQAQSTIAGTHHERNWYRFVRSGLKNALSPFIDSARSAKRH